MNGNVDPRIDKMVAYLYGELPESEERAFRRLLEKDDALRAEYEELAVTRETLGGWEVEERAPSFVLMEGGTPAAPRARRTPAGDGWWARFREGFAGLAITPAWGLAAAAALLLVLAAGGFRVERVESGIAFRFGEPATPPAETTPPSPEKAQGPETMLASGRGATESGDSDLPPEAYLTRDDLETYDSNLMLTLAQLLNEYKRHNDRNVTEGFQSLYQQVTEQRAYDYEQLSGRIDLLGRELLLETDRSARGFEEVLRNQTPENRPLPQDEEE